MPVGIGYDVHRFAPGRRLILAGVEFDSEVGLLGHSDADVATHAVVDALLGAAGLGDIGKHFPPSEPRWRNADSLDLLRGVARLLAEHQWVVGNIDLSIIAERPMIGPHTELMRQRLGAATSTDPKRVSVKATTNEGMGFIGRGEGVAAIAIAEIVPQSGET